MERTNYVDNLRWMAILLLFPFHVAQIWNGGEGYYIWSHTNLILYIFSTAVYPWFMTLLFLLAGISTRFALQKRTYKQYLIERCQKLLLPFIFCVLVLSPIMTYIAEVFFNDYQEGYLNQYILFFTKETDLTGYKGGFTPAHFWFLIYLFVISVLFIVALKGKRHFLKNVKIPTVKYYHLLLLFIPIWASLYIANIGGKSLGQFFMFFALGYALFSKKEVLELLKKNCAATTIIWLISEVIFVYSYCILELRGLLIDGIYIWLGWIGVLALLGIGSKYLNFRNKASCYFTKAAFPIYIMHQVWVVIVGFLVLKYLEGTLLQFITIVIVSLLMTLFSYTIVKKVPILKKFC